MKIKKEDIIKAIDITVYGFIMILNLIIFGFFSIIYYKTGSNYLINTFLGVTAFNSSFWSYAYFKSFENKKKVKK